MGCIIGLLNQRVNLYEVIEVSDGQGGRTETPSLIGSFRACLATVSTGSRTTDFFAEQIAGRRFLDCLFDARSVFPEESKHFIETSDGVEYDILRSNKAPDESVAELLLAESRESHLNV